MFGLNRECEAVWNIKRAHNFKSRACRRQVFYGAANGTAAAESIAPAFKIRWRGATRFSLMESDNRFHF